MTPIPEATEAPEIEEALIEETAEVICIDLNEFRENTHADLLGIVDELPLKLPGGLSRAQLIFEIVRYYLNEGADVEVSGILEQAKESYALLRNPETSFKTAEDDVHVSGELMRQFELRVGNKVRVRLRKMRGQDKLFCASEVLAVEDIPIEEFSAGTVFDKLTPLFPKERLILENKELNRPAMRAIDLIAPLGKGQRGLIVAPPRGGKTILLKQMACAIRANYPEIELIVLLLDERPEEVTDFAETVDAQVYASTFDEPSRRHAQVSDLVIERAKRLVEQKKDVVILLDSLTRLARGYNANQLGGKVMSGGLGSGALEKPRKFFGSARNVEEGGSLTIIATCLVETESRMDEVIFEEFKGTGNLEIKLDRELAERRVFPALHVSQSGTRNDDKLYHPEEYQRIMEVRRQLAAQPIGDALEMLLLNIGRTQNNAEILLRGLR